jgi:CRP/FNR family nitrogen fixation transcriptional regulator
MGTVTSYPRNTEIFGESEPADYLYNVINGGVRTYKIFSDAAGRSAAFICREMLSDLSLPERAPSRRKRLPTRGCA